MRARRLAVLDINDQDVPSFHSGAGVARHFEVRRLRTWKAVQQDIGGADPFRPDIVLADIDFEQDPAVKHVQFSECGDAKPIGPLLALPYVGSRAVWTFAVYSAHFKRGTSGVMESPWVLFPFGVLVAKLEGRVFDSRKLAGGTLPTSVEAIEDYMAQMPRVGNPSAALEEALDLHNVRLIYAVKSGRVRVTNAARLRRELECLKQRCCTEAASSTVGVDPDLYLELYSRSYGIDRIQWLSLCADVVEFVRDVVDADGVKTMLNFASALCGSDPVFQMTIDVIRVQEDREKSQARRPAFDSVAAELYGSEPDDVRREILRLGVLFANAHACAVAHFSGPVRKKEVFTRLGVSEEGNTYMGWFWQRPHQRSRQRSRSSVVCTNTLKVVALDPFVDSNTDAPSYHLDWGTSVLAEHDKVRVQHFLESFEENEGYIIPASLPYLLVA